MDYLIGQVSEKFDLSIHTLRYYEKEGLLPSVKRSKSGIRQYDDATIESLRTIECLKKTGMPLKEIKEFQDWCEAGSRTLGRRKKMFLERKRAVLRQIGELQSALDLIEFKCWYYGQAEAAGSRDVFGWPRENRSVPTGGLFHGPPG